jgi:hypothetical protein
VVCVPLIHFVSHDREILFQLTKVFFNLPATMFASILVNTGNPLVHVHPMPGVASSHPPLQFTRATFHARTRRHVPRAQTRKNSNLIPPPPPTEVSYHQKLARSSRPPSRRSQGPRTQPGGQRRGVVDRDRPKITVVSYSHQAPRQIRADPRNINSLANY